MISWRICWVVKYNSLLICMGKMMQWKIAGSTKRSCRAAPSEQNHHVWWTSKWRSTLRFDSGANDRLCCLYCSSDFTDLATLMTNIADGFHTSCRVLFSKPRCCAGCLIYLLSTQVGEGFLHFVGPMKVPCSPVHRFWSVLLLFHVFRCPVLTNLTPFAWFPHWEIQN